MTFMLKDILAIAAHVVFILATVWLVGASTRKRRILPTAVAVVMWLLDAALLCLAVLVRSAGLKLPHYVWPWAVPVLAVLTIVLFVVDVLRMRNNLSGSSIAEGIDKMPSGQLFFSDTGRILLSNEAMARLSSELIGAIPLNGVELTEQVFAGEFTDAAARVVEKSAAGIVYAFDDGTSWLFTRDEFELSGSRVNQLSAMDVTELMETNDLIRAENEQLESMGERLREYGRDVDELTRQQEILQAKVSIHDELGRTLLATERMLDGSTPTPAPTLLEDWALCVALLRSEARPAPAGDAAEQIQAAGRAIGIEIEIEGELPVSDPEAMRLVTAAARECLTNAVKHAHASKLFITASEDGPMTEVVFSNDGTPPAAPVEEGGGLSGLRASVEEAGGTMLIEYEPEFRLRLRLMRMERGQDL